MIKSDSRSNRFVLAVTFCLVLFQVSNVFAEGAYCERIFAVESYSILRQSPLGKLKARWAESRGEITSAVVAKRYEDAFLEIFNDVNPKELKEAKIRFEKNLDSDAYTALLTEGIVFDKKWKKHWLYPILHAHELQHYKDIRDGLVPYESERSGWLSFEIIVKPEVTVATEIRAHYRHWKAFKTLFTKAELQKLYENETEPTARSLVGAYLEYGERASTFIAMSLENVGSYRYAVNQAYAESRRGDPTSSFYLVNLIHRVLGDKANEMRDEDLE